MPGPAIKNHRPWHQKSPALHQKSPALVDLRLNFTKLSTQKAPAGRLKAQLNNSLRSAHARRPICTLRIYTFLIRSLRALPAPCECSHPGWDPKLGTQDPRKGRASGPKGPLPWPLLGVPAPPGARPGLLGITRHGASVQGKYKYEACKWVGGHARSVESFIAKFRMQMFKYINRYILAWACPLNGQINP